MPLLIASILLCQMAGLIGTVFTASAIPTWYATLIRPSFSPPNYIFGPVWTTLYTLMGISFYLVIKKGLKTKKVKVAVKIFLIHLFLNAIWSIIFFGMKNLGLAFIEIMVMWVFILLTMYKFWKVSKWSTYLLVPYLMWVSFAAFLNFTIWRLN
jgi:translocator protein